MNKNHNEAVEGTDAIQAFVKQFGPNDIYTEILIEELLNELLSKSYKKQPLESRENNATENK